jgi:hypothetical protein
VHFFVIVSLLYHLADGFLPQPEGAASPTAMSDVVPDHPIMPVQGALNASFVRHASPLYQSCPNIRRNAMWASRMMLQDCL